MSPSYLQRILLGPVGLSFLKNINFVKCNLVLFSDDIPASDHASKSANRQLKTTLCNLVISANKTVL